MQLYLGLQEMTIEICPGRSSQSGASSSCSLIVGFSDGHWAGSYIRLLFIDFPGDVGCRQRKFQTSPQKGNIRHRDVGRGDP